MLVAAEDKICSSDDGFQKSEQNSKERVSGNIYLHFRSLYLKGFFFSLSSSAMKCPTYLTYDHCHKACINHCENSTKLSVCKDYPTEGCFCPDGQVIFNDSCVDEEVCTQCISEDGTHHQVTIYLAAYLCEWLGFVLLQVNLSYKSNYFPLWILYFLAQFLITGRLSAPCSSPSVKLAGTDIKFTAGTVQTWKCMTNLCGGRARGKRGGMA